MSLRTVNIFFRYLIYVFIYFDICVIFSSADNICLFSDDIVLNFFLIFFRQVGLSLLNLITIIVSLCINFSVWKLTLKIVKFYTHKKTTHFLTMQHLLENVLKQYDSMILCN